MSPSDQLPDELPDELNAAELRLEQSLRTLRPAPARLDVAAVLAAAARRRNARRRTHLRQAAAAAAVSVAVAWWTPARGPNPNELVTYDPSVKPAMASPVLAPPTVMAYRRAFAHSPAQLEELLDRQAAIPIASQTSPTPVDVLSLRHAEFLSSTGAM